MDLKKRHRFALKAGLVLAGLILGLLLSEVIFRLVPVSGYDPGEMDAGLIQYDERLGWRHQSNWSGMHHHIDFTAGYHTDPRGFRKTGQPAKGAPVLVLGDSFTFGIGVQDQETFSARLQERLPQQRFLNAGVIGYSTDQELLYLDNLLLGLKSDSILLVVYLGNDLIDNLRRIPIQAQRQKPFFVLEDGKELMLKNSPVPFSQSPPSPQTTSYTREILTGVYRPGLFHRLLSKSALGKRLIHLKQEVWGYPELAIENQYRDQIQLFEQLLQRTHQRHSLSLNLILIGGKSYVEQPDSFSAQYQEHLRKEILQLDFPESIKVIDAALPMRSAFREQPQHPFFFPREGHFNPEGHQWMANYLHSQL